jgi:hypothetical protein
MSGISTGLVEVFLEPINLLDDRYRNHQIVVSKHLNGAGVVEKNICIQNIGPGTLPGVFQGSYCSHILSGGSARREGFGGMARSGSGAGDN